MVMEHEQSSMGNGPNLSPWMLVNESWAKRGTGEKTWKAMGASSERGDAKGNMEEGEMIRASWGGVSGATKWEWVGCSRLDGMTPCQTGRFAWFVHGFGNWTAPHPLLQQETTPACYHGDKRLLKPTVSASSGSAGDFTFSAWKVQRLRATANNFAVPKLCISP